MKYKYDDKFADLVAAELASARQKHRYAINSLHEGYAVILEELDEFKAEVWKKAGERTLESIATELVQLAAMVKRTYEDAVRREFPDAP